MVSFGDTGNLRKIPVGSRKSITTSWSPSFSHSSCIPYFPEGIVTASHLPLTTYPSQPVGANTHSPVRSARVSLPAKMEAVASPGHVALSGGGLQVSPSKVFVHPAAKGRSARAPAVKCFRASVKCAVIHAAAVRTEPRSRCAAPALQGTVRQNFSEVKVSRTPALRHYLLCQVPSTEVMVVKGQRPTHSVQVVWEQQQTRPATVHLQLWYT
ncbi:hypothetical protein EYF80_002006 [Liparis tanakae]|uniref:Uncharacterized protein n=1 Tax=Liparis tanakae TaxID=230148 RepID=A0A4Z2JBQ1_9TELE|nr:hypothetical protein EYF80_002006 [Liparis tanakae]